MFLHIPMFFIFSPAVRFRVAALASGGDVRRGPFLVPKKCTVRWPRKFFYLICFSVVIRKHRKLRNLTEIVFYRQEGTALHDGVGSSMVFSSAAELQRMPIDFPVTLNKRWEVFSDLCLSGKHVGKKTDSAVRDHSGEWSAQPWPTSTKRNVVGHDQYRSWCGRCRRWTEIHGCGGAAGVFDYGHVWSWWRRWSWEWRQ